MKRPVAICYVACIWAFSSFSNAWAERIRDLSPEEMAQEPSNPYPRPSMTNLSPGEIIAPPVKSFMEDYCDPDWVPMLANNRKYYGQEQCLKQVRDDACARFKSLPKEVKEVMDGAVGCLFANGNSFAVEKDQAVTNDSVACGASYMHRIDLLKKYIGDYYTAYALLFLPDDVLDTPGRCVNRK